MRWGAHRASTGPSPLSDGDDAPHDRATGANQASTGPSPLSDGDVDGACTVAARTGGFNGAVASQRRRCGFRGVCRPRHDPASTGPSPLSDGDPRDIASNASATGLLQRGRRLSATEIWRNLRPGRDDRYMLQRGRRLSATEIQQRCRPRPLRAVASTGPSPLSDGDGTSQHLLLGHRWVASTGPSPLSDGDIIMWQAKHRGHSQLQRGRRLSATEISAAAGIAETIKRLQRGRRLSATEMSWCPLFKWVPWLLQRGRRLSATEISD